MDWNWINEHWYGSLTIMECTDNIEVDQNWDAYLVAHHIVNLMEDCGGYIP